MFKVSAELLKSIVTLQSNDESGAWARLVNELDKLSKEMSNDIMHAVPEREDFNGRMRFDVSRGIAIGIDVLVHAFQDPVKLLEDVEIIELKSFQSKANNPY